MAQRFALFSPSGDSHSSQHHLLSLKYILFTGLSDVLARSLAKPCYPPDSWEQLCDFLYEAGISDNNHCGDLQPIFRLPIEMQDEIIKYLDFDDIVHLSLTCVHLWKAAQKHFIARHMEYLGCMSGHSFILVGELLESGDIPKTLLDQSRDATMNGASSSSASSSIPICKDSNLWRVACDSKLVNYQKATFFTYDTARDHGFQKEYLALSPRMQTHVLDRINPPLWKFYIAPDDSAWILRNLSKNEYISAGAVDAANMAYQPEGSSATVFGFASIMMFFICWSKDTWLDVGSPEFEHRGRWAGDRFDIVHTAQHDAEAIEQDSWTDVTEEITATIKNIISEYRSCEQTTALLEEELQV